MLEVPFLYENEKLLWTVEGVYNASECATFVHYIEEQNPGLATNNPMYRDQDRVIRDDRDVAAELFQRLKPHLPPSMGDLRLKRLNEKLRFYRYKPGQKFPIHTDHWFRPNEREITLHTVLVYFNEGFSGGETRFTGKVEAVVTPKTGLVSIFQHKLDHEGCEVLSGVKYALRTDTIYGLPE